MALLRKLATGISRNVVRRARPSAKEWAEATARELEFIESDWSAFLWALGGMRVLLRCTAVPLTSLAQVPEIALQLAREVRNRTVLGFASCAFVAGVFSRFGWHSHHTLERTGAYLTAGAGLYMLGQLLLMRGRLSSQCGYPATVAEFRAELKRQHDFHRGFCFWSRSLALPFGYVLYLIGLRLAHPAVGSYSIGFIFVVFVSFYTVGLRANLQKARQYQRRLDQLDALEKTA